MYGCKPWTRQACLKLADIIDTVFVTHFIYLWQSRVLGAQTLWSHCSGPPRSPLRFGGCALCTAVIWNKLNKWSSSGQKETVPGCVLVLWRKEVQVEEETLTSSYQWTERRGFDPSPEPLPESSGQASWRWRVRCCCCAADRRTQTAPMPLPLNSLHKYINTR